MRKCSGFAVGAVLAAVLASSPVFAADAPPKSFAELTASLARQDGLLPVYVDAKQGKIWLSLPAPDKDGVSARYLYLTALKTGLGSAPVGLDRAKVGDAQILAFRRVGKKLVAELENPRFRAAGAPEAEQAAARDAFAVSTIWAGDVAAEAPDGRLLVEVSGLLTRDAMGVTDALKGAGEGVWKPSADLTLADPAMVKVFPENLEFEARQTYTAETPGPEVRNIAPEPRQITLVVRTSLVKLPEPGYASRPFDPRVGGFSTQVLDYAAPLGSPIVQEVANRFRLEKVDPTAARSRVKKPIVFYVDRSAPEPVRTALVEGASWWRQAFEAAGYIDAYRVEVLPEGVDPLDVRYNVVNWVNRATRGWSYGQSIVDPRTGEIVKGSVLLGSLRVRQDMLIFESLVGADQDGTGGPNDPVRVSLMRIRQLAAHEVGHSLGLVHNFAGSTQDRATVMDYPAPRVGLRGGELDLSDAYGVGVGAWDRFAVDWLYSDVPAGPAGSKALDAKAQAGVAKGLRFVSDADSRPLGAAQPWGSLWDDGADPAAELTRMTKVRRVAVDGFGLKALKTGEPVQDLRRKFVPIYLLHRYQIEAAAKLVGGVDYAYAVKGDGREAAPSVPAAAQRQALDALAATLKPAELDVPERLLPLLSATSPGASDRQFDIEVFATQGGPVFDPLVAADVAGGLTLSAVLEPSRLNRLADQHRRDAALPGAGEAIDRMLAATFPAASAGEGRLAEVRRRVATRAVLTLAERRRDAGLSSTVAGEIDQRLAALSLRLKTEKVADQVEAAWRKRLVGLLSDPRELRRVLDQQKERKPAVPPGMPIGEEE